MSLSTVLQIVFNFFLLSGLAILWARYRRNDGDDPRMSRSLQLLQSKISILEDLSDRIDEQLTQASALMEHKKKELDTRISEADRTLYTIQQSRDKSLEVAKIFQDRIPHAEIIERQRTIEYVKAARLAHQGVELSELVKQVHLPAGEVEFIAKMNREQLQFSLEELPDWATGDATSVASEIAAETIAENIAYSGPVIEFPSRPANEFRTNEPSKDSVMTSLLNKAATSQNASTAIRAAASELAEIQNVEAPVLKPRSEIAAKTVHGESVIVQKIVFPRIEVNQHLS